MNPRLAVIVILPVLLKLHLSIAVGAGAVTVSMPWVIPAVLIAAVVTLAWLTVRRMRGFRSSPYPRTIA